MLPAPSSHLRLSLLAILLTAACDSNNGQPRPQTRTYFVAADDVE